MNNKKSIILILLVFVLFGVFCSTMNPDYLPDGRKEADCGVEKFEPQSFLYIAQRAFNGFYKINHRYPDNWNEIPLKIWDFSGKNASDFLTGKGCYIRDKRLIFEDQGLFKTAKYLYIIERVSDDGFLIRSENSAGVRDWVCDKTALWWYYPDEASEVRAFQSYLRNIKAKKGMIVYYNFYFQCEPVFDYLLDMLEGTETTIMEKRLITTVLLENFPHLERFQSYQFRLSKLIDSLTRKYPKTDVEIIIHRINVIRKEIDGTYTRPFSKGVKIGVP